MKHQRGVAMVEIAVTILIITIAISGMGILLLRTIQGTQDSSQQTQAMWIIQDYIGRMRANPDGARDQDYVFGGAVACVAPPAARCANININGTVFNADPGGCSSAEMAIFDRYISVCGASEDVIDSPADNLINPILSSSCTLAHPIRGCVKYNVELTWTTRLQQSGPDAASRVFENSYSMDVELN